MQPYESELVKSAKNIIKKGEPFTLPTNKCTEYNTIKYKSLK